MTFRLAHFADVHMGPLAVAEAFKNFELKRLIGIISWQMNRKRYCSPEIAAALRESVLAEGPDHIIVGGDMVNIAAWSEFARARSYLESFGGPEKLSLAPGNHDAYVPVPEEHGLGQFKAWLTGDMRSPADAEQSLFPSIRLRRNIAIITLNSAIPQGLRFARGVLGESQLAALREALTLLKSRGFCRIINIHHPPLPGLAPDRKALTDAEALQRVLEDAGAELVLHGHNHRTMKHALDSPEVSIPVIGVPAASSNGLGKHEPAAWHMFSINRQNRQWQITMTPYNLEIGSNTFVRGADFPLPSAAPVLQNE